MTLLWSRFPQAEKRSQEAVFEFSHSLGRLLTTALYKRRSAIGFADCKRNFGATLATAATGQERTFTIVADPVGTGHLQTPNTR